MQINSGLVAARPNHLSFPAYRTTMEIVCDQQLMAGIAHKLLVFYQCLMRKALKVWVMLEHATGVTWGWFEVKLGNMLMVCRFHMAEHVLCYSPTSSVVKYALLVTNYFWG